MRRIRIVAGASLGAAALVASSLTATALPTTSGASTAAKGARQSGGGEYVVSYKGDAASAMRAVAASGGQVASVNQGLRLVLVESSDANFLAKAKATDAIVNGARNQSVGFSRLGMHHRYAEERPSLADRAAAGRTGRAAAAAKAAKAEPLASLQWDMQMMGTDAAHTKATGKGVTVGIIDTGVDASHPDLAKHFNRALSRNFTMDIPSIDGPCEVPTCIDPADADQGGHGTHVAGIVGAAQNGIGTTGVAPDATIVNVRAGQDSGFFFLFETVAALTYAGDAGLDVVNMSFFTDPWLYNCDSLDDIVSGPTTPEQLADQQFIRQTVTAATEYAHAHGVTLVAAAGNEHTDLAAPTRNDAISPDFPLGTEVTRVVTNDCLDLPAEGPHVLPVSAVGPSTIKADYSSYGLNKIVVAAPGGYFRDGFGTPTFRTPGNEVLSSYPLQVAIDEGLVDANGNPTDDFSIRSCDKKGNNCGIYTYLQGTSMASPHVAGLAALIIDRFGSGPKKNRSLDPDTVQQIIEDSATDTACNGVLDYTNVGRPPDFNVTCQGTTADNNAYGEGIANAAAAVGA
jgi:subtilisin family serine protease